MLTTTKLMNLYFIWFGIDLLHIYFLSSWPLLIVMLGFESYVGENSSIHCLMAVCCCAGYLYEWSSTAYTKASRLALVSSYAWIISIRFYTSLQIKHTTGSSAAS
jgi:hypothetical protein